MLEKKEGLKYYRLLYLIQTVKSQALLLYQIAIAIGIFMLLSID